MLSGEQPFWKIHLRMCKPTRNVKGRLEAGRPGLLSIPGLGDSLREQKGTRRNGEEGGWGKSAEPGDSLAGKAWKEEAETSVSKMCI